MRRLPLGQDRLVVGRGTRARTVPANGLRILPCPTIHPFHYPSHCHPPKPPPVSPNSSGKSREKLRDLPTDDVRYTVPHARSRLPPEQNRRKKYGEGVGGGTEIDKRYLGAAVRTICKVDAPLVL